MTSVRPLILVSNDDGYQAEGLNLLADGLAEVGDVWVVAPERERSAVSHTISLHKPLRVKRTAETRFWCSGTPTDCVYVGINHLLPRDPDVVVSGVNFGANLGDDVTYSGTVGAAMEAALLGVPALASSLTGVRDAEVDFSGAVTLTVRLARQVLAEGLPPNTLLNLNTPSGYDADQGVRATSLGRRHYGRGVDVNLDPRGRRYLWIGGSAPVYVDRPGSDCNADNDGVASVSPLTIDLTRHDLIATLQRWDGVT